MDINTLPLILAGPILRRVEPATIDSTGKAVETSKVSVWVALKAARPTVTLNIYDVMGNLKFSGSSSTRQLGNNLHVALITAESALNDTNYLLPDAIYYYDLVFNSGENLDNAAVIGYNTSLMIGDYYVPNHPRLPSFALPPSSINNMRITHASCRKPHGEGVDALATLEKVLRAAEYDAQQIANTRTNDPVYNPTNKPHAELYSTAYGLIRPHQLFLTGDQIYADDVAAPLLTMIREASIALMGWQETHASFIGSYSMNVGERKGIMEEAAKFTSDEMDNHLMWLGEFYCMYLFVWSDVLWPGDSAIPEGKGRDELIAFKRTLPEVRRTLAHIPVYMIFDDHDVTDDWNIHRLWCEQVYTNPADATAGSVLGTRIVQNALCAYAVFQAWGNDPGQFVTGRPGASLLNALNTWRGAEDASSQQIKALVGLPSSVTGVPALAWHYNILFKKHLVIVLDTRTKREFEPVAPGNEEAKREAAQLLSPMAISEQISNISKPPGIEATFVISPAPVIGHTYIEEVIQPTFVRIYDLNGSGELDKDKEAWAFNPSAYQSVLHALSQFGKVIILSGDVHYAFSARVEYWNQRDPLLEKLAAFIQLTASSARNENGDSRRIHAWYSTNPQDRSFLGWPTPGEHMYDREISTTTADEYLKLVPVDGAPGKPATFDVTDLTTSSHKIKNRPHWRYKVLFGKDLRPDNVRGTYQRAQYRIPHLNYTSPLNELIEHQRLSMSGKTMAIGHNNLGDIMVYNNGTSIRVYHSLWFTIEDSIDEVRAFTRHEFGFEMPTTQDQPFYGDNGE